MPKSSKINRFVATGLCLSVVFAALGAAAQPPSKEDEIRQKYRQAAALVAEKKPAEAKKLFLEIWNQSKSYDVAASLGQIEYAALDYAAAAQYLSYAVAHYPPHQSDKQLAGLKKWFADAKKHVAGYEIATSAKGALISIDGADVGTTPLDGPIYVAPGKHLLMATLTGHKRAERTLNAAEGGFERLELSLEPAEQTVAPASAAPVAPMTPAAATYQPTLPPEDHVASAQPNPFVLVGGGVVTVGGLVAGLVLNAKANSASDKAEATVDKLGVNGCSGDAGNARDCAELAEYNRSYDRNRDASTVAFVISGAALVGTAVYWLWPRAKQQSGGMGMQVNTSVSRTGSWLGVSGSF